MRGAPNNTLLDSGHAPRFVQTQPLRATQPSLGIAAPNRAPTLPPAACCEPASGRNMQVLYSGVGADSGLVQYSRIAHNQRARPRPCVLRNPLSPHYPSSPNAFIDVPRRPFRNPRLTHLHRTLNSAVPAILD
ncbi:hypothetical protein C8Q70DRAFT_491623 [Cubamyces menziesii]|nr:hypothetical protein C8Q70DRAFT_491623 [Cubamyces menziesii]